MEKKKLNFIFIVQGEGRGHLTQAISLYNIIINAGHEISYLLVGKNERRKIPRFFHEKINSPIEAFESPNFVADSQGKGIKIINTILYNIAGSGIFFKSLKRIREVLNEKSPDVVINFYDILGGLNNLGFKKRNIKFLTIGHQYFLEHNDFDFPEGSTTDRNLLKMLNKITSIGYDKKLALSFREVNDEAAKKIFVVPPLLRKEVLNLKTEKGEHILVYINMPGYSEEIIEWHKKNPEIVLHCFWDKKEVENPWVVNKNLTFHQVDDQLFLEYMKSARGFVSTAGFESVCEAMYLGIPVMMVPIQGQFEQTCNAIDAKKSGAGVSANTFNISKLLEYLPHHQNKSEIFRAWVQKSENIFLKYLEE